MPATGSPVAVLGDQDAAEAAIRHLSQAGFPMEQFSLIGRGYHIEEHPIGFHTKGDRILGWEACGTLRGGIWGLPLGAGVFLPPGVGPILLSGPIVAMLATALESAAVVGGVGAIEAALANLGLPPDEALRVEAEVNAEKFLILIHGTAEGVARTREAPRTRGPDAVAAPAQAAPSVVAALPDAVGGP